MKPTMLVLFSLLASVALAAHHQGAVMHADFGVVGSVTFSVGDNPYDIATVMMNGGWLDNPGEAGDNLGPNADITWEDCQAGGFKYHIHSGGTGLAATAFTGAECGPDVTGGHYDPDGAATKSCQREDGNEDAACADVAEEGCEGVVAGCEWVHVTPYDCDMDSADFSCEVGDLSGKYGLFASQQGAVSYFDASLAGEDFSGMSIVAHCSNGDRAFCAPLTEIAVEHNWTASFGDAGALTLTGETGGSIAVQIDAAAIATASGEDGPSADVTWAECWGAGEIKVHVHTDLVSGAGADYGYGHETCLTAGGHYDPTNVKGRDGDAYSCLPDDWPTTTEWGEMTTPTMDWGSIFDATNDCEVGDISGKLGTYDIAGGAEWAASMIGITGLEENLSIVFHCEDAAVRAFCANLKVTTVPEEKESEEEEEAEEASPATTYSAVVAMMVSLFMML